MQKDTTVAKITQKWQAASGGKQGMVGTGGVGRSENRAVTRTKQERQSGSMWSQEVRGGGKDGKGTGVSSEKTRTDSWRG